MGLIFPDSHYARDRSAETTILTTMTMSMSKLSLSHPAAIQMPGTSRCRTGRGVHGVTSQDLVEGAAMCRECHS